MSTTTLIFPADMRAKHREGRAALRTLCAPGGDALMGENAYSCTITSRGLKADASPQVIGELSDWLHKWQEAAAAAGAELETRRKNFKLAKGLTLPKKITFHSRGSLARFLGRVSCERLTWMRKSALHLSQIAGVDELDTHARMALYLSIPEEINLITRLAEWRAGMGASDLAQMNVREIQVPGMHSKWIERNKAFVLSVFLSLGWARHAECLEDALGLARKDNRALNMRFHPEMCLSGLPERGTYPLAGLPDRPAGLKRVIIVENKANFLGMHLNPGDCVLWGAGQAIVGYARDLGWIREFPSVIYWGDCDGHGFMMLNGLRAQIPQLQSTKMGWSEMAPMMGLSTSVGATKLYGGDLPHLTDDELRLHHAIQLNKGRIEQEHIPRSSWSIPPSEDVAAAAP